MLNLGASRKKLLRAIHIIVVSSTLLALVQCNAQETSQYYSYSAKNADLTKAQSDALSGLVQEIQSFVKTVLRHDKSEVGRAYNDSTTSSVIAVSSIKLTNVQEKIEREPDGSYRVTKYVSRSAVKEMFDQRKNRILELLGVAQLELGNCERNGSINLEIVLKNLYWAYLLASIHPYQINYSFKDESGFPLRDSSEVLEGIRYLFETVVSKIKITPIKRIEDANVVWKCRFEYAGVPISGLDYSFFDGVGQTDGKVKNSESVLTLFFPDSDKKEREVDLSIDFKSQDEMDELLQFADEMVQSRFPSKSIVLLLSSDGKDHAGNSATMKKDLLPKSVQEILDHNTSLTEVLETLNGMVKKNLIIIGRREDFESPDGIYGLVLDEAGIVTVITEQNGQWTDVLHSRSIERQELNGKKITWIEPHRN